MNTKFKLTDECINLGDRKLYRIEALKDFSNVKKGDKGGFVESEENLSQNGSCWLYDDARVFGDAAHEALQGLYDWCIKNGFIK